MTKAELQQKMNQFFLTWNGKSPDFDGWFGSQCVDLVQYWNKELGGIPFWGDYAYQLARQTQNIYQWIENDEFTKLEVGDIPVWTQGFNGWAGHTGAIATGEGVVEGKDTDWFEAFVSNDPKGSVAHLRKYSYNFVIGWLRPIVKDNFSADVQAVKANQLVNELFTTVRSGLDVGDPQATQKMAEIKRICQEIINIL